MLLSLIIYTLLGVTRSHLIFDRPEVWGIENPILLEQPLDGTTDPWICAGNSPRNNGVITLQAGRTYNYSIICGERDLNSPGCLAGDWHAGENVDQYSGCVLSVNYNLNDHTNPDDYYYISHSRECGKRGTPSSFTIANNIENCNNCVCSWSWAPTRRYSSPGQFYNNCFYCTITSPNGSKENMKKQDFINVKGSAFKDTTYNELLSPRSLEYNYTPRVPQVPRVPRVPQVPRVPRVPQVPQGPLPTTVIERTIVRSVVRPLRPIVKNTSMTDC